MDCALRALAHTPATATLAGQGNTATQVSSGCRQWEVNEGAKGGLRTGLRRHVAPWLTHNTARTALCCCACGGALGRSLLMHRHAIGGRMPSSVCSGLHCISDHSLVQSGRVARNSHLSGYVAECARCFAGLRAFDDSSHVFVSLFPFQSVLLRATAPQSLALA